MASQTFAEVDLNSPGYEFLRSHRSMNNLFFKLVALDYLQDFCPLYKCPPIHRYYFSLLDSKNPSEQVFIFTCLCAWLIKNKCHMNLDLSPEEYQDIDATIGTIFEALKLLLSIESEQDEKSVARVINFAPARLKQGFGPEVIWTLSILADRALELSVEAGAFNSSRVQIIFHEKQATIASVTGEVQSVNKTAGGQNQSITIGQPIVGGGLTTRPLGNYRIDDSSLLFDDDDDENQVSSTKVDTNEAKSLERGLDLSQAMFEPDLWLHQVERDTPALRVANKLIVDGASNLGTLRDRISESRRINKGVQDFLNQSKSILEIIANRIEKQLQIINGREKFLQSNLGPQLDEFRKIWSTYNEQQKLNDRLIEQVSSKTDLFESHICKLRSLGEQIEERTRELNDGTKLRQLQDLVRSLERESGELELRVNLLLIVYAKRRQSSIED